MSAEMLERDDISVYIVAGVPKSFKRKLSAFVAEEAKEGEGGVMLHGVLVALLSMPFRMLLPAFALDVYGALPDAAGWLLAANGAGAMIAGLGIASLRRGQRRGLVLMVASLFTGVALIAIGAFPWYLVGMMAMVLMGVGHGAGFGLGPALIMENADEEYRGRVMSVFMMTFGLMPLGVMPLSLAMDHFGPEVAVLTMGVMLLVVASLLIATQGRLRRLQ
jgi:MFS family permease